MPLTTVFDPYKAAQAIADIDLIKSYNPGCYTLAGVPYVATITPSGIVLEKAGKPCGKAWIAEAKRCDPQKKQHALKNRRGDLERFANTKREAKGMKPKGQQAATSAPQKTTAPASKKSQAGKKPQGKTPPLKQLFDRADEVGSKYQDPSDPPSLTAKRKANEIVDESMGGLTNKARGVADLDARRKAKAGEAVGDRTSEPESGGSIVPAGGKLSAAPKTPKASNAEGQEAINQRYATANPSEAHVDGWLKDSIQEYLSPASDKALHAETLKELKIHHGIYEGHVSGDLHDTYKQIRDRQSFAEGAADSNEHYVNVVRKGKLMTPEDVGLWSNEPELQSAERRMKSGKTEASRVKAKQEFEKLSAKKTQTLAESAAIAEKMNSKYTAPREEQIQRYLKIYDDKFAAAKEEKEQLHQQYMKGDKKAVQTVTERVLRPLDTFSPTDMFEGKKKVKDPSRVYREAVRSHLVQTHQQGGGDAATLGLQGTPNSPEELKAAYRRAATKHHPDRGGSRDAFEQVRGAYERLADEHYPDMRKSLDPYFTWGRDYYVAVATPSGVVLKKATA